MMTTWAVAWPLLLLVAAANARAHTSALPRGMLDVTTLGVDNTGAHDVTAKLQVRR